MLRFNFVFRYVSAFYSFFRCNIIGAMALGAGIAATGSLIASYLNNKSTASANKKNLKFQKWLATQNFTRQDKAFDYQKYLNNNQIQIQAADAQKAGINPLAMNGGSLSSGSYSNVSGNADQVPSDYSSISSAADSIASSIVSGSIQKEMNDDSNETSQAISDSNNQTQKDIADAKNASAEKMEQIRQDGETARLQAQLVAEAEEREKDRQNAKGISDSNNSSNEKVAGNNLAETKRHNEAMEKVEDFKSVTDRNYKEALVKMQRAVNEAKISLEWSNDARQNEMILKQKQYLDKQMEYLEKEISQKNWERANIIWRNLIDTGKTVSSFLAPIKIQK